MANEKQNKTLLLAHIEMHKVNGDTVAVEKHLASPGIRAIVDAAKKRETAAKDPKQGKKKD